MSPALLDTLLINPWFAGLPPAERELMLAKAELQRLRPGQQLFRQGDAPQALYALVQGTLKMSKQRDDGKEAILVVLEAGTWFGEISLTDGQPRSHDATALGPAQVLALPRAAFDELMTRAPFASAIATLLAGRLRLLYGIVDDATLRSTRARVARRLLLLARGDATMATSARLRVPVSQEALAMMLGIARQTVSRELKLLVELGALRLGYAHIEILSERLLQELGDAG